MGGFCRATTSRCSDENIRLFISGSAPLLAETHVQFDQRTGHRILERYGMTETSMITTNPYDGERRPGQLADPWMEKRSELPILTPEQSLARAKLVWALDLLGRGRKAYHKKRNKQKCRIS